MITRAPTQINLQIHGLLSSGEEMWSTAIGVNGQGELGFSLQGFFFCVCVLISTGQQVDTNMPQSNEINFIHRCDEINIT